MDGTPSTSTTPCRACRQSPTSCSVLDGSGLNEAPAAGSMPELGRDVLLPERAGWLLAPGDLLFSVAAASAAASMTLLVSALSLMESASSSWDEGGTGAGLLGAEGMGLG